MALADIDRNGIPDLLYTFVLAGLENRYMIGWNLNLTDVKINSTSLFGMPTSWEL
jgi:hypothetical protein